MPANPKRCRKWLKRPCRQAFFWRHFFCRYSRYRQEKVRPYLNRWQKALVGIGRSGNGIDLVRSMAARRPQLSVEWTNENEAVVWIRQTLDLCLHHSTDVLESYIIFASGLLLGLSHTPPLDSPRAYPRAEKWFYWPNKWRDVWPQSGFGFKKSFILLFSLVS